MNIPIHHTQYPFFEFVKKDGSLRLCIYYRKLNQATLVQQELMPNPEDMFSKLAKAKIFNKIDLMRLY